MIVEVTLQNGSFFPRRSHTYTADHIDYIPNLPVSFPVALCFPAGDGLETLLYQPAE